MLVQTLIFVIPQPTLFYLAVEIIHLYTLSDILESLSTIILANVSWFLVHCLVMVTLLALQEAFVQNVVDSKSLTDAECLCLLKAVPKPPHSLGWLCLLDAVVIMYLCEGYT